MTSVARGTLEPKTFGFKWTIKYFFANCEKVGDFYTSPVFPIQYPNKTKWYLQIYPKGDDAKNKDYVSLYLIFKSENVIEVTAHYQLSIVSKRNNLLNMPRKGTKVFKNPGWGWQRFVHQNVIKDTKNDALIDDTLTIVCEVTFNPTPQDITKEFKKLSFSKERSSVGYDHFILEDYEKLLETSYLSDVTLNVQGKKIYLHKAILMCRNSIFKAMFEHEMKEKNQSSVDIIDVEYKVMKELFRFIYSGKVENIEKIAKDLLFAADKYCITELKDLCENTLYNNLIVDNAIEYLKLTDMCDTIRLKTLTLKFVADHYKIVVKKPEFAGLNSDVMHQIIQSIADKD